jgi:predicted O-linked N-acetylglucosamine transferase (SPINDLY family)
MSTKAAARKKPHSVPPLVSQLTAQPAASAATILQQAKNGSLSLDDLIKAADEWQKQGRLDEIDLLYKSWLDGTQSPYKFIACFNYGVLLANWGRNLEAISIYEMAISLNPSFAHARINLGLTMERQGKPEKALEYWREVVDNPVVNQAAGLDMRTTALNHIGRLLEIQKDYAPAEEALAQSLEMNPQQPDAIHHWFHLRQKQCKWPLLENLPPGITKNQVIRSMSPLAALAYDDDPAFQMYIGEKIVREKFTYPVPALTEKGQTYGHDRIRIGYLSGDLCTHAVGLLLPELFELHDRSRFEIFAYDYSREDGSPLRQRYKDIIENFTSIAGLNDQQAAVKIRADEIDILVDLHGLSLGLRAGVLAQRPAPIQLTYIGYIGATMMPYIDYVITDKYCFTADQAPYYSEAPLLLDRACLPTDRKKQIEPTPTRESAGLPSDKFIYATFNNSYKLNERMFACWMNILKRVPNSVLWIVDDNVWATQNLRNFASQHGVSGDRLIFTGRVTPPAYLARMPLADLFLDNHPYNAGSTASDILWMGAPMITLSGKTFVSRMAGSMLHHAGLSELITNSHAAYEELAVQLSQQPDRLKNISARMLAQRASGGSFDMELFTRNLEQKYMELMR